MLLLLNPKLMMGGNIADRKQRIDVSYLRVCVRPEDFSYDEFVQCESLSYLTICCTTFN